ncbi:MAG: PilZ domain-containing protein [Acidobacteriaceae bacterium]
MESNTIATPARNKVTRARRYTIGTKIQYRVRGERRWYEGMTENISVSGILLWADHLVKPKTAVEMKFVLPVELSGERAAELFCRGVVVRSSKSNAPISSVAIASTIASSRFFRQATD